MIKNWAAIDIGTHTARLLIARKPEPNGQIQTLARKRAYIRLGAGFSAQEGKIIQTEAIHRTIDVLKDFLRAIEEFNVCSVKALATGVVREADNRKEFFDLIYDQTGIRAQSITGDTEAVLTAKGVMQALDVKGGPLLIFDLGGGSTEFLLIREGVTAVRSVPLGSLILKHAYLHSDPPEDEQVAALSRHILRLLEETGFEPGGTEDHYFVAGTGGTVTALAAMLHGLSWEEITPERVNGLPLTVGRLETLVDRLKNMKIEEISSLPGLDPDRSEVILAGSLMVRGILRFFESNRLVVSISDLLEGILIDCIEGEVKNG